MKTSDSISKISPALLNAQKATSAVLKGASNPFFKSKYADINSVIEALKKPFNDCGIIILQPHKADELGDFVETVLLHESGEWMQSETRIVCAKANDPQALGSAVTYARRYGLQSFGLLPAEDDDGEGAMNRKAKADPPKINQAQIKSLENGFSKVPNVKIKFLQAYGITKTEDLPASKFGEASNALNARIDANS